MLVIVPSGSFLDDELFIETGCRSHAMIPLGGKPLILHILDEYKKIDENVSVVLVVPSELVVDLKIYEEFGLSVVGVKDSLSLAQSILSGLNSPTVYSDGIVIHMGDTLISLSQKMCFDTIFTSQCNDLYRWTSLISENGVIKILQDRDPDYLISEFSTVSVGVFSFLNIEQLRLQLEMAIASPVKMLDPFFSAVSEYSKIHKINLVNAENWYDFGHVDKYYESKLLYQNLRHFNQLSYDKVTGKITKTSTNIQQFRHQVRWFNQVPDELRSYCPHIYASSDGEHPFITMELLPFSTLTELFVYKKIKLGAWNPVVKMITNILTRFSQYEYATNTAVALSTMMYRDKTIERINKLIDQRSDIINYCITHANKKYTILTVLEQLDNYLKRFKLLELGELTPIHGDFCFSNLLYDTRSGIIKMIDARGEFGVPGIYGDPRYDLAKLFHSIDGGYDFIIMDKFKLLVTNTGELNLKLYYENYHLDVVKLFKKLLLSDRVVCVQTEAIQALLFLSMLPLHSDKPERQLAMLAVGLKKFAELMNSVEDVLL